MFAKVLTDTVIYNHRIVDIVTNNGQDSTNEGLIYLKRESNPSITQWETTDNNSCIENKSYDRTNRETDVTEA